jgi:hypothetical protein
MAPSSLSVQIFPFLFLNASHLNLCLSCIYSHCSFYFHLEYLFPYFLLPRAVAVFHRRLFFRINVIGVTVIRVANAFFCITAIGKYFDGLVIIIFIFLP